MNEPKRVRWGVIGLGWFGEVHADNLAEMPDIELTALCTRRPNRLGELADRLGIEKRYTDYRKLLTDPDVDVVSITTHIYDHREIPIDAFRSGKHVLLEKPMSPTAADCDQIVHAAAEGNCLLLARQDWQFTMPQASRCPIQCTRTFCRSAPKPRFSDTQVSRRQMVLCTRVASAWLLLTATGDSTRRVLGGYSVTTRLSCFHLSVMPPRCPKPPVLHVPYCLRCP
ncbi:MAG: Gfo/Idh/MocA family oxidoreductase [Fuerstiella sp.]|nr:Gfo/Idh/MocA family oxidoreductase [Fuerstiella sp.]MCP4853430.1 Gfo/Idh/MocA family oxidoreductase [Fuerstiella sp.]